MWNESRRALKPAQALTSLSPINVLPSTYISVNDEPDGDMPRDVVFTPDGKQAILVNRDTDNMAFFDVATREITSMVDLEDFPVSVDVTPDGRYALATNVFSNSVSVIDVASQTIVTHIPVTGAEPYRVVTTPDSRYAVIGVINDAVSSSFSVIDLDRLEETQSFPSAPQGAIGASFCPESATFANLYGQFAVTPDGSTIVLPVRYQNRVVIYDRVTGAELASLPTAERPTAVDISLDGKLAVVSHESFARRITVIDLPTLTIRASHPTNDNLHNRVIRLTPDGRFAIAALLNHVIFVDILTGATTSTLYTGGPGDIEISHDGRYAFVANKYSKIVDLSTQTIAASVTSEYCYWAAISPVDLRAVTINICTGEELQFYSIDGAASFAEGSSPSGPPPEGDAPRAVAITPDCGTAVTVNNNSENVAVIDLDSQGVTDYVPTGERSLGIAVTPDGASAVVTNATSDTLSVIDLVNQVNVVDLSVPESPVEVRISPDGSAAYVASLAGDDRIHFIELDGALSRVTGSMYVGEMGVWYYGGGVFSGIELSPEGSLLAVCESFDDIVRFIHTVTQRTLIAIPVGDFPIRAAFSPDGTHAFITNLFGDSVQILDLTAGYAEATIPGIEAPVSVHVDQAGQYLYVGSFDYYNPGIQVIDIQSETVIATVPLDDPIRDTHLSNAESVLYVATAGPELVRVQADGVNSHVLNSDPLTDEPYGMAFCEGTRTAVVAEPFPDGVDVITPHRHSDGFESGDCTGWSERQPPP